MILSPVLSELKKRGAIIILHTSERGMIVFKNNPYVDEFIPYETNSVKIEELNEYWAKLEWKYKIDKTINFCESIEVRLALHPSSPQYNYTKKERYELCNKNYYDETFVVAGMPEIKGRLPEFYPTEEEEEKVRSYFDNLKDYFVILVGISGSGVNKKYIWIGEVISEILKRYKGKVKFITCGGEGDLELENMIEKPLASKELKEQLLNEILIDEGVIDKVGKWNVRETFLATKYADLVVAPDTGLLHASGCYDTPKIGLLGHTTKENITKYFKNDYSIEAECNCAPCFRLIYQPFQCPLDYETGAVWCMSKGIPKEKVIKQIERVISESGKVK